MEVEKVGGDKFESFHEAMQSNGLALEFLRAIVRRAYERLLVEVNVDGKTAVVANSEMETWPMAEFAPAERVR